MRVLSALVLSLVLVPCLYAEPELKGNPSELAQYLAGVPRTVVITAEAEVQVPADRAVVSLKVTTENRSLQDALRANQDVRAKLLAQLKKENIPVDRIQTSKFSSTPKYGWLSEKAKSYRVENVVKIKVQDEKEFQAAAGLVDNYSEVQYLGVEFEHADRDALKIKAISQACEKAGEKKKLFEEKLGLALTPARFSGGSVMQKGGLLGLLSGGVRADKATSTSWNSASRELVPNVEITQADESVSSFGELVYVVEIAVEYTVQPK